MLIGNSGFIYNSIAENTVDTPLTIGLMSAINQRLGEIVRCLFAEDHTTLHIMTPYIIIPRVTQENLQNFLEKVYGIITYPVTNYSLCVAFPSLSTTISKEKQDEVITLLKMQGHI